MLFRIAGLHTLTGSQRRNSMQEKKFDSESEKKFYNFLLESGIPENAIIVQPNVDGKNLFRPDVAIINPATKEYIAIFEVKGHWAPLERGICQVYRYLNELGNNAVQAFLTIQDKNGDFKFFTKKSRDGTETTIEVPSAILNLENLIKSYNATSIQNINIAKKSSISFLNAA